MVPTMRKHLDRIRFRGQKRDEFLDLAESPNTSDTECAEESLIKPRGSVRDLEELREMDGEQQSDAQVGKQEFECYAFFCQETDTSNAAYCLRSHAVLFTLSGWSWILFCVSPR